jgi:hypothetical protein
MICSKNGAIINLTSHHAALRCDVYRLHGYGWLFRVNNHVMPWDDDPDFIVHEYDNWYDEHGPMFGTMIVPDAEIEISHKFIAYTEDCLHQIGKEIRDEFFDRSVPSPRTNHQAKEGDSSER